MTDNLVVHKAPWPTDWYATQDPVRGVLFCDRKSDREARVEPPASWGLRWRWNLVEDGSGVYFREG